MTTRNISVSRNVWRLKHRPEGDIAGPAFGSVEADNPHGVLVLACEEIGDDGFEIGLLDIGLPADRLMFGSDFPHPEGMGDPLAYSAVVADLPLDQQALIMGGALEKAMKVGQYA